MARVSDDDNWPTFWTPQDHDLDPFVPPLPGYSPPAIRLPQTKDDPVSRAVRRWSTFSVYVSR